MDALDAILDRDHLLVDIRLGKPAELVRVHVSGRFGDACAEFEADRWRRMDYGERLAAIRDQCYDAVGLHQFETLCVITR